MLETRLNRREFLKAMAVAMMYPLAAPYASDIYGCAEPSKEIWVNDIHSRLNRTRVSSIFLPEDISDVSDAVFMAKGTGREIAIAGGRHSMGGQQFATDSMLLDTAGLNQILNFDPVQGTVEVMAGIQWPKLIDELLEMQQGQEKQWGISQKPTGTDSISVGGCLSSNVHSRGLKKKPFIQDVASFTLMDGHGKIHQCSRSENTDLFQLAIGGYGLFGVICTVTLRLARRQKIVRNVSVVKTEDVMDQLNAAMENGALYGDYQFAIDGDAYDFLREGIVSVYTPVDPSTATERHQKKLDLDDWEDLVRMAHSDKSRAFKKYMDHYLKTDGQIYWSDLHQLGPYRNHYHKAIDKSLPRPMQGTEMITEIYVPRDDLAAFFNEVRKDFRKNNVSLIYGTVRLIEQDDESFLAWAKQPYACTIFNLHVTHTPQGMKASAEAFRRLIQLAIRFKGSYYLTYHKYASRQMVETCYPQFLKFLRMKKKHDPAERFQSNWYRHYRKMFL